MNTSELLSFAQDFIARAQAQNITPILYGSLACTYYCPSAHFTINDIDLLVPESDFATLHKISHSMEGVTSESTTYHSIKFYRNGHKIAFDASEHYLTNLTPKLKQVNIQGIPFTVIDKETLKAVYRLGVENIPSKATAYAQKLSLLENH